MTRLMFLALTITGFLGSILGAPVELEQGHEDKISGAADVVIIGAGVSGIATAITLLNEGIDDFIILEGSDEVGGRVQTQILENKALEQTTYIETGANWIEGEHAEEIIALADKWNLKTVSEGYVASDIKYFKGNWGMNPLDRSRPRGEFIHPDRETAALKDAFCRAYDYTYYRIKHNLVDITLRAGLRIANWLPRSPIEKLMEWFWVDYMTAKSPKSCSLLHTLMSSQYKPFGEEEDVRLVVDQKGYKSIFADELKEKFNGTLDDPRLRLSTVVRNVNYSGGEIVLTTENNERYVARKHIVSTVSVGVLQDRYLTWTPDLPDWKREAISAFDMTYYQKIHLLFDRQFWGNEVHIGYADPEVRGRYPLWKNLNAPGYFNGSETGYIFFVTQTEDEAIRVSNMDKEDVKAEVLHKLREMYGDDVPEPLDMTLPLWNHNPLFRGSFSNWPIGFSDQHHWNLRQPVDDGRLMFTGEACSYESFGFVQGAWSEGRKSGHLISQCMLEGICPKSEIFKHIHGQCASKEASQGLSVTNRYERPLRHQAAVMDQQ